MKKTIAKKFLTSVTACLMFSSAVSCAFAQAKPLNVKQTLDIINPDKDITTTYANYYITGSSDPNKELYLNGHPIENRGKYGSFGIYVDLSVGRNVVEMTQNGASEKLYITRVDSSSQVTPSTTKNVTSMFPVYDYGIKAGNTVEIQCTAPSGASVYAVVNGQTVNLKQVAATSVSGVPAIFKGQYTASSNSSNSTTNVGKVTYYMNNGGVQSSWNSVGDLYVVGSNADFVVEVKEENVVTFAQGKKVQPYYSVLRKGSTDKVVDMTGDLYQLASGGWIRQNAVTPIAGNASVYATFNDVKFSQSATRDIYNFSTTSKPAFKVTQTDQNITVKFYNTDGISSIPYAEGRFFSGASVTSENGNLTLSFDIKQGQVVWGYDISYVDGGVQLIFKERPFLGSSDKPLANTVVCLDPGHGGKDSGALGVQGTKGPMEKDITLATAYAIKERLEGLGAYVVLTRTDDTFINLDDRDKVARANNSDFLISVHANSVAVNRNGNEAKGVEVYYNQPNSYKLAQNLFNNTTANTGRPQRKVFYSHYIITLGTHAPSTLLEMGFMPNPVEYDDMCSPSGMESVAKSVTDSVLACLK